MPPARYIQGSLDLGWHTLVADTQNLELRRQIVAAGGHIDVLAQRRY